MKTAVLLNTDAAVEAASRQLAAGLTVLAFSDTVTALNALSQMSPLPDYLVINMRDFPRHWKVMKMTVDPGVSLVLYNPETPDEKEAEKARSLGIPWYTDINELFESLGASGKHAVTGTRDAIPEAGTIPALSAQTPSLDGGRSSRQPAETGRHGTVVLSFDNRLWVGEIEAIDEAGISCTGLPSLGSGLHTATLVFESDAPVEVSLLSVPGNARRLFFSEPLPRI